MRLFFLELIRFLLYSYCTNDQIEQTCKDLPREYLSCFTTLKTLLAVPQQKIVTSLQTQVCQNFNSLS